MSRPARRDALLAAAELVVRRDGAAHLTLDAVALEAGTSKGGLLYHFPTKDDLVAAMVERLIGSFDAVLTAAAAADPQVAGRHTRAYVRATAAVDGPSTDDLTATALLAAVASSPVLAEPMRAGYVRWREAILDDGIPAEDALLIALAADGLWLADLLGLAPPPPELRARVLARMLAITGGVQ